MLYQRQTLVIGLRRKEEKYKFVFIVTCITVMQVTINRVIFSYNVSYDKSIGVVFESMYSCSYL